MLKPLVSSHEYIRLSRKPTYRAYLKGEPLAYNTLMSDLPIGFVSKNRTGAFRIALSMFLCNAIPELTHVYMSKFNLISIIAKSDAQNAVNDIPISLMKLIIDLKAYTKLSNESLYRRMLTCNTCC